MMAQDQGWAWVVLGASFLNFFLIGWFVYSVGIIHVELLDVFQEETSITVLVGAIHSSIIYVAGPMAGVLVNLYTCRVSTFFAGVFILVAMTTASFTINIPALIVTYGFCSGFALCIANVSGHVAVGLNFQKYRGSALGFSISGAGVGTLCGGPLTRKLLDEYGLSGTLLILGAIGSHLCVVGLLMRPTFLERRPTIERHVTEPSTVEEQRDLTEKGQERVRSETKVKTITELLWTIVRNKPFILYSLSIFWRSFGLSITCMYLPVYSEMNGQSHADAALLMTFFGVGNIVGRPLVGALISNNDICALMLHAAQVGLTGILNILFPLFVKYYAGQVAFALMFGIYIGGATVLLVPITVLLTGIEYLTMAFSVLVCFSGIGYFLGSPIAGVLLDSGASYDVLFILSGAALLFAALFTILIPSIRPRDPDTQANPTSDKLENT